MNCRAVPGPCGSAHNRCIASRWRQFAVHAAIAQLYSSGLARFVKAASHAGLPMRQRRRFADLWSLDTYQQEVLQT
jgi:hypothetical protein